jgi:hypothetical protein
MTETWQRSGRARACLPRQQQQPGWNSHVSSGAASSAALSWQPAPQAALACDPQAGTP